MPEPKLSATVYRVEFDSRKADLDSLMASIKEIMGRSGCPNCGRLSILDIQFDPRVHFEREIAGVRSVTELVRDVDVGR